MRQVRYQVFVSSTFRDLKEERQAVLDAILGMNHFPAGMELFPASDSTPWEIIERVIDDSDYYVLIVGGMYGSTDSRGVSYTEREYDYARHTDTPVLAFLHEAPENIPAGKVEMTPDARVKLAEFREKLQSHHCKYWRDAQDLQYKVALSLVQEINLNPGTGWVRANISAAARDIGEALAAARNATQEAELQRRLRDEAELRAQSTEAEISALRELEARAKEEAAAAADREAAAIEQELTAKLALQEAEGESIPSHVDSSQDAISGLNLSHAKKLLAGTGGDVRALVIWGSTPQGDDFWFKEANRVDSGGDLSPEANDAIASWVEHAEREDAI